MVKVLQGDITREDKVMDGVVGIVMFSGKDRTKMEFNKPQVNGLSRHNRLGSSSDGIRCAGRIGSGAQAVGMGLISSWTHGRRTLLVYMGGL